MTGPDDTTLARLRHRIERSAQVRCMRLLWRSSRWLTLALAIEVLASSILPIGVLLAIGALIGRIHAVAGAGSDGPDLTGGVALVGVAFLASLLVGPAHGWLASAIKTKLTAATRARLMAAVSHPIGVAHLDDPATLDRLANAQGNLSGFFPADAPVVLGRVLGYRITWLTGCLIVGTFRWWLGLALVVLWQATRNPLLRVVREHVAAFGGQAAVMRRADYFHDLGTGLSAAKEIRLFGLGPWAVDRYRALWTEGMAEVWRIRAGVSSRIAKIAALLFLVYGGALAVVAHASYHGTIDVAEVAVLVPVLFMTMTTGGISFDDITLEWQLAGLPELESVERDLGRAGASMGGNEDPPSTLQVGIELEALTFAYPGASRPVLASLDLTLPAGRSTAIVGANGAGKTTLVKLLARLHDPSTGRILVDGQPLDALDPRAWQRKVAIVFQDFVRLPFSLAENISAGAPEAVEDREGVLDCASRAGLEIGELPDIWSVPLSSQLDGGTDLSGGQWQRVALARALFAVRHGASVLVLDEPTAALDARREAAFFESFLDLSAGLTTVLISHRFSTVRLADQICVVRDGAISELGSHADLLAAKGDYERMFRLQAAPFTHRTATS